MIESVGNLCHLHRTMSRRMGEKIAMRFPSLGRFRDISYRDVRRQADRAAAGLITLGIAPGDRVGILSENRVEWPIADLGILSAGAADVTMHAPLSADQVEYQLGHSEARGVLVSNQDQADKVIARLDELPDLEFLVSFESVTLPESRLLQLSWQGLCHRGARASLDDQIASREQALDSSSLATLIYTSGTTGNPKGVMLTHGNLLSNVESMIPIAFLESDDILLSWLPYSHVYARLTDNYLATGAGITVALAAGIDTLIDDLDTIKPTWLTAVPRFYEKIWTGVEALDPDARANRLKTIFGPRIRQLNSGGAPLPRHVCDGFDQAGLPILEGYGLTETSPVISFNHAEAYRFGSVGLPIPGVEVRIAQDGEILTRGPHVMAGYWKNPEATEAVIVDGWFHTGDVGTIDEDGFLSITDRKKDLFVTSAGKNVAPAVIERLLTTDPLFDQAVVYGDGRNFISAVVVPNLPLLETLATTNDAAMETEDGLVTSPELLAIIDSKVSELMESVSQPERVKKCLVLDQPFQLENDELTATLKVRRRHIIAKYEDQLAAFYEG
ncbi:MAG: long-chain fatty acid--CoA ligase [Planctomycetota bacterium]|nr:long-chain fatty acid--CoA ligase [Planctomycetota bacterium]